MVLRVPFVPKSPYATDPTPVHDRSLSKVSRTIEFTAPSDFVKLWRQVLRHRSAVSNARFRKQQPGHLETAQSSERETVLVAVSSDNPATPLLAEQPTCG